LLYSKIDYDKYILQAKLILGQLSVRKWGLGLAVLLLLIARVNWGQNSGRKMLGVQESAIFTPFLVQIPIINHIRAFITRS
jgi:hypothetical protein